MTVKKSIPVFLSIAALLAGCGGGGSDSGFSGFFPQSNPPATGGQSVQPPASDPPSTGGGEVVPPVMLIDPPLSDAAKKILGTDSAEYKLLQPLNDPNFTLLGRVKPRTTGELRAAGLTNSFGVGGETTDRNYTYYENWGEYIAPLGVTKVRVQTGWHDIEKVITTPPTYDWAKFDKIVNGLTAQKAQPFVFLGYGNQRPGCVDCGETGLSSKLVPTGEGRTRFLAFVTAAVERYKDRVSDWQIWNEPNGHVEATEFAKFTVDVAQTIKRVQPEAKLTIGNFTAGVLGNGATDGLPYAQTLFDYFAANKGPMVPSSDVSVGYHPYWGLPEHEFTGYRNFRDAVFANGFKVRQDENGMPSGACLSFANCGPGSERWDEKNQAKNAMRRALGDFYKGFETSIFSISDMHYDYGKNNKGLLTTGTWDANVDEPFNNGDSTIKAKKIAYGSYQNITSIFDSRMSVIPAPVQPPAAQPVACTAKATYTGRPELGSVNVVVHAYKQLDKGVARNVLAIWVSASNGLPYDLPTAKINIDCKNFHFARMAEKGVLPKYVDLMDGRVYTTSAAVVTANDAATDSVLLKDITVTDWPIVIADDGVVDFTPK